MAAPRLDLSLAAKADIDAIWQYTASTWSIDQADNYFNGIADALENLAYRRIAGTAVDIRPGIQKCLHGSHAIYFRWSVERLEILRILHQSMDVSRHLT